MLSFVTPLVANLYLWLWLAAAAGSWILTRGSRRRSSHRSSGSGPQRSSMNRTGNGRSSMRCSSSGCRSNDCRSHAHWCRSYWGSRSRSGHCPCSIKYHCAVLNIMERAAAVLCHWCR